MKQTCSVLLLTVAVTLTLAGCGLGGSTLVLGDSDANRMIEMRSGDRLNIVLTSNPSTGYNWQVVGGDTSVVAQVGAPVWKADQPGLPGGGGKLSIPFLAEAPGRTTLKLAYSRPWDRETPAAKTYDVTVIVK